MLAPSAMFHHSMACQALALPCAPLQRARTVLPVGRRHVGRLRCESSAAAGAAGDRGGFLVESASPPRRSAEYQPSLWTDSFIQTLTSDYTGEAHMAKLEELKGRVRHLLKEAVGVAAQLELADVLHRLGVAYHFEQEIESMLHAMSTNLDDSRRKLHGDLTHTALLFRLLRQHGVPVPQDAFDSFRDEQGKFKDSLRDDVEGILSLYEASFLAYEEEKTLYEARAFTTSRLQELLLSNNMEANVREMVEFALEVPLHLRTPRLYARWFIEMCQSEERVSPVLLELAKLDFNMVQSKHIIEIKALSRWWEENGLKNLNFTRDRIMENFIATIEMAFDPKFSYGRYRLTQVLALVTIIDDFYDIYGLIDELKFFIEAIGRWDESSIKEIPNHMKTCFQVLFTTTNEFSHQCFMEGGLSCLSNLKTSWIELCKSFLVEERWYYHKQIPSLGEYLENAWISSTVPVILTYAYLLLNENVSMDDLDTIVNYGDITRWTSMIFRLCNDLGTSKAEIKRGDVPKSIQCHMHERNVSEAVAREHIKTLINNAWMKVNREYSFNKNLPKSFMNVAMNFARMAFCIYHNGDGYGAPDKETKHHVKLLLIEPFKE